jgi:hypothetical protein
MGHMLKRDPERLARLRIAIRYLLTNDAFERGDQVRLAKHFRITRQRVHQVIVEEEMRTGTLRLKKQPSEAGSAH